MEYLTLAVIGLATAAFVLAPLWSRSQGATAINAKGEVWHTLPQLEIDHSLGKIDDAEYEELKKQLKQPAVSWPVEALVMNFRRERRLNTSLEAEVLIARARRKRR